MIKVYLKGAVLVVQWCVLLQRAGPKSMLIQGTESKSSIFYSVCRAAEQGLYLYTAVIDRQLSECPVPTCFAVRLCTCCLCSGGAAPSRSSSENKWISCFRDLLADEPFALWLRSKQIKTAFSCLVVPPSTRLLWDSKSSARFLPRDSNLLSWSLNRPHHLQWLAGGTLICRAEGDREGDRTPAR